MKSFPLCTQCGKGQRHLNPYKSELLCRRCYLKKMTIIKNMDPQVVTFTTHFSVTAQEKEAIEKRLAYLAPVDRETISLHQYVKALVMNDIEAFANGEPTRK